MVFKWLGLFSMALGTGSFFMKGSYIATREYIKLINLFSEWLDHLFQENGKLF